MRLISLLFLILFSLSCVQESAPVRPDRQTPGLGGDLNNGDYVLKSQSFRVIGKAQISDLAIQNAIQAGQDIEEVYYFDLPQINLHDDGVNPKTDTPSVVHAMRPPLECGKESANRSLSELSVDCQTENGDNASWIGKDKATSGEGVWRLITKRSGIEVWQDVTTGLIWSDVVDSVNWCEATGNKEDGNTVDCIDYDSEEVFDLCRLEIPDYRDGKGRINSTDPDDADIVKWTVPTRNEFLQADLNGARFVLPAFKSNKRFWSSTVDSSNRDFAWTFRGEDGVLDSRKRDTNQHVVCVGRVLRN
jgi:hypothetical protein